MFFHDVFQKKVVKYLNESEISRVGCVPFLKQIKVSKNKLMEFLKRRKCLVDLERIQDWTIVRSQAWACSYNFLRSQSPNIWIENSFYIMSLIETTNQRLKWLIGFILLAWVEFATATGTPNSWIVIVIDRRYHKEHILQEI